MAERKPNRTEKIMAMAATMATNSNEAANAARKLQLVPEGSDAVALIRLATRALEQANALPDIIEVADKAAAIRTYVKRVTANVEAENEASLLVYRAERKAGGELRRMAEAGERPLRGEWQTGHGRGEDVAGRNIFTLAELGVERPDAARWQKLARLSDAELCALAAAKRGAGERLSRADFLREVDRLAPKTKRTPVHPMDGPAEIIERPAELPYVRDVTPPADDNDWDARWQALRLAALALGDDLAHGWPTQADRTRERWVEYDAQVNEVGRVLLWFQKRVREYMA